MGQRGGTVSEDRAADPFQCLRVHRALRGAPLETVEFENLAGHLGDQGNLDAALMGTGLVLENEEADARTNSDPDSSRQNRGWRSTRRPSPSAFCAGCTTQGKAAQRSSRPSRLPRRRISRQLGPGAARCRVGRCGEPAMAIGPWRGSAGAWGAAHALDIGFACLSV